MPNIALYYWVLLFCNNLLNYSINIIHCTCFQGFAINNAAINILIHNSLCTSMIIFLGYIPKMESLGQRVWVF